ncbi:Plasminogen receptor (KT) [Larimichthys crocea]|uniref:Uncharacterized protein n=1 Tax=Larimichthys crocea TaxID=215358 RepID=A0ACD3QNH4_LARCR|nr:Plasminogen receptor (KT) [Larimichthys crocea]
MGFPAVQVYGFKPQKAARVHAPQLTAAVLIIGNCECGEVADGAIDDYWLFDALIRGGSEISKRMTRGIKYLITDKKGVFFFISALSKTNVQYRWLTSCYVTQMGEGMTSRKTFDYCAEDEQQASSLMQVADPSSQLRPPPPPPPHSPPLPPPPSKSADSQGVVTAIKRKRPAMLFPIFPLGFILAYQMDSAYGTLIYRMRGEAESIMESEHDRLDLPLGTPTFESIEKARRAKSSLSSFLEK